MSLTFLPILFYWYFVPKYFSTWSIISKFSFTFQKSKIFFEKKTDRRKKNPTHTSPSSLHANPSIQDNEEQLIPVLATTLASAQIPASLFQFYLFILCMEIRLKSSRRRDLTYCSLISIWWLQCAMIWSVRVRAWIITLPLSPNRDVMNLLEFIFALICDSPWSCDTINTQSLRHVFAEVLASGARNSTQHSVDNSTRHDEQKLFVCSRIQSIVSEVTPVRPWNRFEERHCGWSSRALRGRFVFILYFSIFAKWIGMEQLLWKMKRELNNGFIFASRPTQISNVPRERARD